MKFNQGDHHCCWNDTYIILYGLTKPAMYNVPYVNEIAASASLNDSLYDSYFNSFLWES